MIFLQRKIENLEVRETFGTGTFNTIRFLLVLEIIQISLHMMEKSSRILLNFAEINQTHQARVTDMLAVQQRAIHQSKENFLKFQKR